MRKILLSLTILGGLAAGAGAATAAPAALPGPVLDNPAQVQTVQWRPDWQAHRAYWRARRYEREHRLYRDDTEPAECDVRSDGHGPVARAEDEPEEYPRHGDSPREPEERPAPTAAQHQQREGRVRARDEEIYAAVIQDL